MLQGKVLLELPLLELLGPHDADSGSVNVFKRNAFVLAGGAVPVRHVCDAHARARENG